MGINWFEEGVITAAYPSLLRKLRKCEVRSEYDRGIRPSKVSAERNGIKIPKQKPGDVFHQQLFSMLFHADSGAGTIRAEFSIPTVEFDARPLTAIADGVGFEGDTPKRIFEYKSGRGKHVVYPSDHIQPQAIGLALCLAFSGGDPIENLHYTLVLADYGCGLCPKVVVRSKKPAYHCDQSECRDRQKPNNLTAFDFPFRLNKAEDAVRDEMDFLEGRRVARGSTSPELCDNCPYRGECPYRMRPPDPSL